MSAARTFYRVKVRIPGAKGWKTLRYRFKSEDDARHYMRSCYSVSKDYKIVPEPPAAAG